MKGQVQIITLLTTIALATLTGVAQNSRNPQTSAPDMQTQDEKAKNDADRLSKKERKEEEKRLAQQAAVRCARLGKKH